jgi:uncharacterized protein
MTAEAAAPRPWPVLSAVVIGLLVAAAGIVPWTVMASLNARINPEIPWAALITAAYLALLLFWLGGGGPPGSTRSQRRYLLRLWRPEPSAWRGENLLAIGGFALAAIALYPIWLMFTPRASPADLAAYPTTAYRMSVVFMGALVSGVVEEAAFRGYMLSKLERFGCDFAVPVMAGAFVLSHATHGLAMLPLAPGLFVAGMLYGHLALRTGSILPGALIHSVGDASVTYFGTLGGDASLLFVR